MVAHAAQLTCSRAGSLQLQMSQLCGTGKPEIAGQHSSHFMIDTRCVFFFFKHHHTMLLIHQIPNLMSNKQPHAGHITVGNFHFIIKKKSVFESTVCVSFVQ